MIRPETVFSDSTPPESFDKSKPTTGYWAAFWGRLKAVYLPVRESPDDTHVKGGPVPVVGRPTGPRPSTLYDDAPGGIPSGVPSGGPPDVLEVGTHEIIFGSPAPIKEWDKYRSVLVSQIEAENPRVRVKGARLDDDRRHVYIDVEVVP